MHNEMRGVTGAGLELWRVERLYVLDCKLGVFLFPRDAI